MSANLDPDISKTVACRRVLKFKKRNSGTFEATPPSPGGGPGPTIFLHIFSWVRSMNPSNFEVDISTKSLGKIFPQGGPTPKNVFLSDYSSPRAMRLQRFIAKSQKLWPLGVSKIRAHKQKNRQTCRCPAKTGSPIAVTHIPLD